MIRNVYLFSLREKSSLSIIMLPKRRHSIQTVSADKSRTNERSDSITEDEQIQLRNNKGTRRQSIAESIQLMTKSVSK